MIIYVVVIILIILFFISFNLNKEHYTLKLNDVSLSTCGTMCTEGVNCSAFSYKPKSKSCYLSKNFIFGIPYGEQYENEYLQTDKRCNKINKIVDETIFDDNAYTHNSVYSCSDGEKNLTNLFQFANYGSTCVDDIIPEKVKYDTSYIDWNKKSLKPNKIFLSKTYDKLQKDIIYVDYLN